MNKIKSLTNFKKIIASLLLLFTLTLTAAPNIGDAAPDFEITTLDGETFKLSEYKDNQPVYLIFWATWCKVCKKEVPKFKQLHSEFGDKIKILAINVDHLSFWSSLSKSNSAVKKYIDKYELPYTVALDDEEKIIKLFDVMGTPTQLFIDAQGIIKNRSHVFNRKSLALLKAI